MSHVSASLLAITDLIRLGREDLNIKSATLARLIYLHVETLSLVMTRI